MLASSYPLFDVFLSVLYFFCFFLWIFLMVTVLIDVFASHDMGGWAKAGWILFLILIPFISVLVYLIARGGKMQQHRVEAMKQSQEAFENEVRQVAGTNSADQLHKLADLKDRGVLSDAEFEAQKAKILAS
jgi:hypothetical protein